MSKNDYEGLGLSEQELAALNGDDDDETIDSASSVDNGDLDSDDDNDDDLPPVDDDQLAKPDAEKPAANEPGDAPVEELEKPAEFEPTVAPVEDFENKIAELVSKEDELSDKFDEGEITQREFRQQVRELDKQRRELEDQQRNFERHQAIEEQKWYWEVDRFMDDAKEKTGIDYRKNPLLNAAFDTAVKQLAKDDANDDKPGSWFLKEAHKKVSELLGKSVDPAPKDPVKDALNSRRPDLSTVPRNLADVPAAQNDQPGSTKFDKLDQLTGMDLERALAALPESEARAYLER